MTGGRPYEIIWCQSGAITLAFQRDFRHLSHLKAGEGVGSDPEAVLTISRTDAILCVRFFLRWNPVNLAIRMFVKLYGGATYHIQKNRQTCVNMPDLLQMPYERF